MEDSIHHWKAAVSLRLADPRRQVFLRWHRRCAGVLRAWVVPSGRIAMTAAASEAICSTLPEDAPLRPLQRRNGHVEGDRRRQRKDHARASSRPAYYWQSGRASSVAGRTQSVSALRCSRPDLDLAVTTQMLFCRLP